MSQLSKLLLILVISAASLLQASAQIRGRYNIGSIGNTASVRSIYSGPVYIKGSQCFELTNGVKTLSTPSTGLFSMTCKESVEPTQMEIMGYPNPVISYVTIKPIAKFPINNLTVYYLQLLDMNGRVISVHKTNVWGLNEGYKISMANLPSGYYTVALSADGQKIQALKIIKTN